MGYQGRRYNPFYYRLFVEHGEVCFYCKEKIAFENITVDHFFPRSKGHTKKNNRVFACKDCNSSKSDKNIYQFREFTCTRLAHYLKTGKSKKRKKKRSKIICHCPHKIRRYKTIIKTCTEILHSNKLPTY